MSESEHAPTGMQPELPLPFHEFAGDLPLLPVRMVNEYEYCPRLAYLEWVQGEWTDSGDTVQGRWVHRRVDKTAGKLPEPGGKSSDVGGFGSHSAAAAGQPQVCPLFTGGHLPAR